MEHYAGMDISLEEASVCVMDGDGLVLWRGTVACDGASIVAALLPATTAWNRSG